MYKYINIFRSLSSLAKKDNINFSLCDLLGLIVVKALAQFCFESLKFPNNCLNIEHENLLNDSVPTQRRELNFEHA